MLKVLAILALTISSVEAAGGGHGGSVMDLLIPAGNFGLLFGFLFFKLRKPVSDFFTKNAEEVESLYNSAEEKDKEAQVKLDMYAKKLEGLVTEVKKIKEDSQKQASEFIAKNAVETKQTIAKMETDADAKVEYEKNSLLRDINASLVDEVINKAKSTIKSNDDLGMKATKKLVAEIQ